MIEPTTMMAFSNISKGEATEATGQAISIIQNYQKAKSTIRQLKADAKAVLGFGEVEAQRIREKALNVKSDATAQAARAGLDITSQQNQDIQSTITFNSETNAYEIKQAAKNQYDKMMHEAEQMRKANRSNAFKGVLNLGGNLLKSATGPKG
jgi:hypothetical protein